MLREPRLRVVALCAASWLAACGGAPPPATTAGPAAGASPAGGEEPVVNVYNWPDYIDRALLERFSAETGLRVDYDTFDSAEVLEAKLAAGRSGYDVVVATASTIGRQLKAGVFRPLDKDLLSNLGNVDAAFAAKLAAVDPGNAHGVPYHWGTTGVGWDEKQIRARLPAAPADGLAMVLDPKVASRVADCGIAFVDSPMDVVQTVLAWLGRDPNGESPEDLAAVERVLMAVRPHVRYVGNPPIISDLANGEICLALGWSGDVLRARDRAREAGTGVDVRYALPREGTVMFVDLLMIPADAPHPGNAHRLIDFILRADVAAALGTHLRYPNANAASWPLYDPAVRADPLVFPPADVQAGLVTDTEESREFRRLVTRTWTRFKTGR